MIEVQEYVPDPLTPDMFVDVVKDLHREKKRLERVLIEIRMQMDAYYWLENGARGSYAWDDDRYYQEIGNCFNSIRESIDSTMNKTDHTLCCDTFRHVNPDLKVPVQLKLFKQYKDFPAFTEDVLKVAMTEGKVD